MEEIKIKGLAQNNLKNLSFKLPKKKIIVFTGVSGSGKSSIVFDTIAAESQRQINETYSAFVRGRLPKYEKPLVELIENLTASVIVDQSQLGGNIRSTVPIYMQRCDFCFRESENHMLVQHRIFPLTTLMECVRNVQE